MTTAAGPLATLEALLGAPVDTADHAECDRQLGLLARLRGWVDVREAEVSSRVRALNTPAPAAAPQVEPADAGEQLGLAANLGAAAATEAHTRNGGVSAAEGRRKSRRAEALDHLLAFRQALARAEIAAEHVDALANVMSAADEQVRAGLIARERELLTAATSQTPERFARTCRDRARRLERDRGLSHALQQRLNTYLTRRLNPVTGMIEGSFALHPELADQIFGAIGREVDAMVAEGEERGDPEFVGRTVNRNRLAAEALGRLVAGGHQAARPLEADLTVIADAVTLATGELHDHSICETGGGAPLLPSAVHRLLCNARVALIARDEHGNPFDMGRTIRNANRAQRRALRTMYRTCAFHGCDVAFDRCEIHHIIRWELGGPTDLINLLPLCSRHHHMVHGLGWRLELAPDRTLTIIDPNGEIRARSRPNLCSPSPGQGHDDKSPPGDPPDSSPPGFRLQEIA